MKTRVLYDLICRAFAGAIVGSLLSVLTPLCVMRAQAATLVNIHYLKIEKSDTLSEALARQFSCVGSQLWGKNGVVEQISALNPQIRDVNRLHPGDLIDLGKYASRPVCKKHSPASLSQAEPAQELLQGPAEEPEPKDQLYDADKEDAPMKSASERYGLLEVFPEFSFSRIDSVDKTTGGSAIYTSNLIPGVRLSWAQHWSNSVQTSLNIGVRSESYIAPAGYVLESSSHIMTDFGLGVRWIPIKVLTDLAIDSALEFRQENFARAVSLTSVRLDAVMIPELSAGLRYRVLDLSPFTLTLHARGMILLPQSPSGYSVQFGTGAAFGLILTEDISKNMRLTGGLQYSSRSQDTSIATQSRTDVGLSVGITFRIDAVFNHADVKSGEMP